jgi:universal stress protein E
MKKFHQILVGMDFSPASQAALQTAARFAAHDGGQVTVLHVMDPVRASEIKQSHGFTDEQVFEDMRARVVSFMEHAQVPTGQMTVEVDMGHAFVQMVKACHRHSTDLLVLGSRGSEHGPMQIGTMAAKSVRKAPADVLLVRENVAGPFKHVLACVDFSETSAHAVQDARKVAEQDGAQLDCLFVFQSALALSLDYGGYLPASALMPNTELLNTWKKNMDEFLQPLLREAKGIQWRAVVEERPSVRESIYDHVQVAKIDLVVLGTRGKTDLRALIMGTTAEKIVTHAPCSVLAVKPDDFEYDVG